MRPHFQQHWWVMFLQISEVGLSKRFLDNEVFAFLISSLPRASMLLYAPNPSIGTFEDFFQASAFALRVGQYQELCLLDVLLRVLLRFQFHRFHAVICSKSQIRRSRIFSDASDDFFHASAFFFLFAGREVPRALFLGRAS